MSSSGELEVGRIDRAHGLEGEVVVTLVTNRLERVQPGAELGSDRGPLVVRSARPQGNRWLVRFEDVDDRGAAEGLRGAVLRAAPLDDPDALWVHELVGQDVVDATGRHRGRVEAVQANPASDLLVLDSGALVPLVFVRSPSGAAPLVVDGPDGLFDDVGDDGAPERSAP